MNQFWWEINKNLFIAHQWIIGQALFKLIIKQMILLILMIDIWEWVILLSKALTQNKPTILFYCQNKIR